MVDSGEAPSEIVAPAPSIETACPGPARAPDDAVMSRSFGVAHHKLDRLQVATQNPKIHLLTDTQSQKPTYRVSVWK